MFVHRDRGGHSVEHLERLLRSVRHGLLDDLTAALSVSGQHAAEHHKVSARAKRLGDVARVRAAAIGHDKCAEAVGGVRTLDHGGQLGIAHTSLLTGGAHGAGTDADLGETEQSDQSQGKVRRKA